jgi:hypothetical protein
MELLSRDGDEAEGAEGTVAVRRSVVAQTTTEVDVDYVFQPKVDGRSGADLPELTMFADLHRSASSCADFFRPAAPAASPSSDVDLSESTASSVDQLRFQASSSSVPPLSLAAVETALIYLGREAGPYGAPSPPSRMSFDAKLLQGAHPAAAALRLVLADAGEGPYTHNLEEEAMVYDSSDDGDGDAASSSESANDDADGGGDDGSNGASLDLLDGLL